jgi:hypothetical protein
MKIEDYREATKKLKDFYDWSIVVRGDRNDLHGPWEPMLYELIKFQNSLRRAETEVKKIIVNMGCSESLIDLELNKNGDVVVMINSAGGLAGWARH